MTKRVKAIVITDNAVYETHNVRVFKDFILVDNVPYPRPPPRFTDKHVYYIINESSLDKEQLDKLERLIAKKETETIFNAFLNISNPTRMIMYIGAGVIAGMYIQSFIERFFRYIESLPPDQAGNAMQIAQLIAAIALIAIPLVFILRRRSGTVPST